MAIERRNSIAIIGGGIGGLTAAVSLLRAGFDVQVYEQARTLAEIGAGINILVLMHRAFCIGWGLPTSSRGQASSPSVSNNDAGKMVVFCSAPR